MNSQLYVITKLITDKVIGLALLLLFSPLLLLIAAIIMLTSEGPIFFKQKRGGLNRVPFEILKFRTMYFQQSSEEVVQAKQNDPRITPFGGFLRRHSLDELPQLINVVLGDMSLVGPRPHALQHDALFEARCPEYTQRFRVKSGVTGWAQVNGYRGLIHTDDNIKNRTALDNFYIDNWSVRFEIYILLTTLIAPIWSPNAH